MKTLETRAQLAPLRGKERRMYLGAFWLFIIAEEMIFVILFTTKFLLAYAARPAGLDYVLGSLPTVLFLVSIWPTRLAVLSMGRGDAQAMGRWLLVTMALGLVGLAGIFYDWATLGISAGSRFGENYYVTEGYHALYIFIGVLALAALWASRWRFTPPGLLGGAGRCAFLVLRRRGLGRALYRILSCLRRRNAMTLLVVVPASPGLPTWWWMGWIAIAAALYIFMGWWTPSCKRLPVLSLPLRFRSTWR